MFQSLKDVNQYLKEQKIQAVDLKFCDLWSSKQRETIKPLPTSLEESLTELENDHEFLLAGDVFSCEVLEEWVEHKRKEEIDPVRARPHPYEISLYFDV